MHELSIALSLVDVACGKAAALGDIRVDAVFIRIGPLAGVVKESLLFCFDEAAKGSAIEGARLEIADGVGRDLDLTALEVSDCAAHR
jgi:hydrogenase nickel incorporation protein HypA/HybF